MVGLGDLPGGTFYSLAEAISADGSAIAGASQSGNGYEAFLWTIAAGMIPLGDLPGGDFWSEAWSVSDGKVVVGRGRTASGGAGERAFIWDATHGMRELKTVLENEYGLNLGGWTLSTGTGISPDGTIIMGNGLSPTGRNTGWVVFLPEPSTFALLLGAGVASLLAYAWRRRKRAA
jgi:probable HAF family extracellular repeat protein